MVRRALLLAVPVAALAFACGDSSEEPAPADWQPPDGATADVADAGNGDEPFDGAATPECVVAEGAAKATSGELDDPSGKATVSSEGEGCARRFSFTSTAQRRDDEPKSPRLVEERADGPSVQTGNVLFDGLYQLALDEARELSVSSIRDGAFRGGAPLPCAEGGCFETGRKWTYVWTRDTAYAMHLGLAWIDPARAASSLDFKLSPRRDGSDLQIVQDTGSGGSYPVSTDRAVWALGAMETLRVQPEGATGAFADRAFTALRNTFEHDVEAVFDARDGLYRGEQSFLDWREQSYPGWVVPDMAHIAASKSLSTNAAHLALLDSLAELAELRGDKSASRAIATRAAALRTAMRARFLLADEGKLSTFITTELDGAPARRFDLLGTSLAVLLGVTTREEGRVVLSRYPTLPAGPPVMFPQERGVPIYHNRAIWPFVTAYWAKAGRKVGHDGVVTHAVRSLMRGAALNLSNMENLEVRTGKPFVEDGSLSGPVVNSQRQLWSVAGYIGTVHGVLFGLEATRAGLEVAPFVPDALRRALFGGARSIALNNVAFRGKKLTVVLRLPEASGTEVKGALRVERVRVNGQTVDGGLVPETLLAARNLIEVDLGAAAAPIAVAELAADASDEAFYAPRTPRVTSVSTSGGKLVLGLDPSGEDTARVAFRVYRDGVLVAGSVAGSATSFTDPTSTDSGPSHCYTVETYYLATGNASHRANPQCFWGAGGARIQTIGAASFAMVGGSPVNAYGRFFYEAWGDAGHRIEAPFVAAQSGEHLVQLRYGNGAGPISTGITCAVKRVEVREQGTNALAGAGYAVMPQRADWGSWGESSFVRATLAAGKSYRVVVANDARSANMSAFAHFADYTGGTGGSSGGFERVNVSDVVVLGRAP